MVLLNVTIWWGPMALKLVREDLGIEDAGTER